MSDSSIRQEHQPPKGKLKNLKTLWSFVKPYKFQLVNGVFLPAARGWYVSGDPTRDGRHR